VRCGQNGVADPGPKAVRPEKQIGQVGQPLTSEHTSKRDHFSRVLAYRRRSSAKLMVKVVGSSRPRG